MTQATDQTEVIDDELSEAESAPRSSVCYPAGSVGGTLHEMMTNNGLWPQETDAVMESVRTEKHAEALAEVLGKTWEGYPKQFHAVAWMIVKRMVVEYIDANQPEHFARPMFTG